VRFDAPSVQALYEEHVDYVRTLVARLLGPAVDPDDVTQEVFIVAWRRIRRFDGENARAWLRKIAIHLAASYRRRARVRRFFGPETAGTLLDSRTPERVAQASEETRLAYSLLETMSPKRRTVFILFELQGLTGEEIAVALGCPLETVRTRLFHARRELRSRWEAVVAGERTAARERR
jgi:RNA polymerase sigma-70 factor (ECF subfamily)